MTRLMITIAAGALLTAPVQAQSHDHGAAPASAAGHECPMHKAESDHAMDPAHRYMPMMVLKGAAMLKLTTDQVAALEKLQAAHKEECEQRMTQVKETEAAAAKLLEAPVVDLPAYEAGLRAAADLKVKCRVGMVATGMQAKALLTPDQLAHLAHMSHAGH